MLLRAVEDLERWRQIAPSLHICNRSYLRRQRTLSFDPTTLQDARTTLSEEGYVHLLPQKWQLPLNELARLIGDLHDRSIPLTFCFVYDEFWCLSYALSPLIASLLGGTFSRLPDFWAWLIDPEQEAQGWKPHRDRGRDSLFRNGTPKSLSIWLPLTDATPLNGCMYVVPANRDPTYGLPNDEDFQFHFQDIRALPAKAGSILGWNQEVVHWGGRASKRGSAPRISVAFEFQSCAAKPMRPFLMDPHTVPDFKSRLGLIATQILQYRHMYPLDGRIERLARRLVAETPSHCMITLSPWSVNEEPLPRDRAGSSPYSRDRRLSGKT